MTEEQAIERIEHAIGELMPGLYRIQLEYAANAAWNEMKAIAREDKRVVTNVLYGSYTLNPDGSKAWRHNPTLDMTAAEQWAHNQQASAAVVSTKTGCSPVGWQRAASRRERWLAT